VYEIDVGIDAIESNVENVVRRRGGGWFIVM